MSRFLFASCCALGLGAAQAGEPVGYVLSASEGWTVSYAGEVRPIGGGQQIEDGGVLAHTADAGELKFVRTGRPEPVTCPVDPICQSSLHAESSSAGMADRLTYALSLLIEHPDRYAPSISRGRKPLEDAVICRRGSKIDLAPGLGPAAPARLEFSLVRVGDVTAFEGVLDGRAGAHAWVSAGGVSDGLYDLFDAFGDQARVAVRERGCGRARADFDAARAEITSWGIDESAAASLRLAVLAGVAETKR